MRTIDIIVKKRDGKELTAEEIRYVVQGLSTDKIPDYQIAAFLMAVYFQGMNTTELAALTKEMIVSGEVFDLSSLAAPKVDKHSTGGVGDKVSLVLAPLVASAGVVVPMVSGRALGHTGGTLDKLESIPGFSASLDATRFCQQVKEIGLAIIGQTEDFVPADKRLYALRDVTGTIESIPLIASSILSKKIASGAEAFVFDVKTGNGAFMSDISRAQALAKTLVNLAKKLGKKALALITDMNQPLGQAVGNSLEVIEAIEGLKNQGPKDLKEIVLSLGSHMLLLGGIAHSLDEARTKLDHHLTQGLALKKFKELVIAQGGNASVIDDYQFLNLSDKKNYIKAPTDGYLSEFSTRRIGYASMLLGAGRQRYRDPIDYGVGLIVRKKLGQKVKSGETVFEIYYRAEPSLKEATASLEKSFVIQPAPPEPLELIKQVID